MSQRRFGVERFFREDRRDAKAGIEAVLKRAVHARLRVGNALRLQAIEESFVRRPGKVHRGRILLAFVDELDALEPKIRERI